MKMTSIHYGGIEKQVLAIFRRILFAPIIAIIKEANAQPIQVSNAKPTALEEALLSGRVQYRDGVFSGKFSAAIARVIRALGGKFDANTKTYSIKHALVPNWVTAAAVTYNTKAVSAHEEIERQLDQMQKDLDAAIEQTHIEAAPMIEQVNKGFRTTAEALSVHPTLTPASKDQMAAEYNDNMKLWIKKWCEEEITDLRGRVEENADQGYRFDRLIEVIQSRYGVSERKAEFLARQETSLFMAEFRKLRVMESGVTQYKWSTSHDERVRSSHKHLDGRTFFYDDPPTVDTATNRKANPGQDFNCRCVDIPILPPLVKAA